MIDVASREQLKEAIADCIGADQSTLDSLRKEIRPLKHCTRRIQPRTTTSISLVGTDGGNNQLQFDPFLIQLIRVVDSSNNEYCLEAISPTTSIQKLNERQFTADRSACTALGEMMAFLGVDTLPALSHMIRPVDGGKLVSPGWVQVYREMVEWAILFKILGKDYGTDTLIICDGLLRSKSFAKDLFPRLLNGMKSRIDAQWSRSRRHVYLAGVAKHSQVLSRYRLAMALEGVLQTDYPAYVEVSREIERHSYIWPEFAEGEFVGGKMFLVKFGSQPKDPVWPIDIFVPQVEESQVILGSMLADAINGFPVPHYPHCLQKAHESAALVDFDFDILQDFIYEGVRSSLGVDAGILDAFRLQDADPAQRRYD